MLETKNDEFVSGQELSNELRKSRTAIWKHMKELEKDGYIIDAVPRKGYRIREFPKKLSSNTIQWGLHTKWLGSKIIHKKSVPSTQNIAHQLAQEGAQHGTVIIADEQTAGRGRLERKWHSMSEQGIWMSLLLRPKIPPIQAPQLTLLAATVLADILLKKVNVKAYIKWPNDIILNDKKIAGILTEMQAEQDQIQYIVLGIGINVNQSHHEFPEELKSIATSLKIETNKTHNIRDLIQSILTTFEQTYDHYLQNGFHDIKMKWESFGYKLGETVNITTPNHTWNTTILGIESDGGLLIKNPDGKTEKIYSAEIYNEGNTR
ncbi:biotin--[acetyl-CoA-carboxylase] ligase [Aquibacillus albus]|uniref:biotin--[acetyl-CoA-carboxylase] ligase n=1 Tax=Aquibacillus albus TaxID=1168171 RepID=UPI003083F8E9